MLSAGRSSAETPTVDRESRLCSTGRAKAQVQPGRKDSCGQEDRRGDFGWRYEERRAERAERILDQMNTSADDWRRICAASPKVGTKLWPLGKDAANDLTWHGYTQAMVPLHVLHDFPLIDASNADSARRLVT